MKNQFVAAVVLLATGLAPQFSIAASQTLDAITLQSGDHQVHLTLRELKAKLPTVQVKMDDPVYKTPRTWDAFRLEELMKLLGQTPASADEVVFVAADGYAPSISRAKLEGHSAYLAYQEHGRKDRFEKVRQGKAMLSPGPFYLVWGEGRNLGEEYPWPYQLVKIEVVSFREKYAKIFPGDAKPASEEMRGFILFKNECIRCHSVNLVGGDIGPELNTPRNVLEYWNEKTLRELVKNAPSFRARSKMPPFPNLKDSDLDDIFAYLGWASRHKAAAN